MVAGSASNAGGRPRLGGVESLRAYAAFAIVIFHVIHLAQAPVPQSLEFMKDFFGYGVPLFFVVSAFSLAYGYDGRVFGDGRLQEFYLRRLLRIAPLYYLALATWMAAMALIGGPPPSLSLLVLCLTFLFNLAPDAVDGIAPASWSIGVEMLFYVIFPFVMALARTLPRAILVTVAFGGLALVFAATGTRLKLNPSFVVHGLLFNLPYFGFGLIAFRLSQFASPRLGGVLTIAGLVMTVAMWASASMLAGRIGWTVNILYMMAWGAPFALICLGMALRPLAILSNPATEFLGKISFGLYLGHPQVIFVLSQLGVYERIQEIPGGSGVTFPLAVLVTSAALIPIAWVLYAFIERPGMELGRRWGRRLRAASSAPARTADGLIAAQAAPPSAEQI
ncbi:MULTISPECIES: acyltransferase family protein [Phenylobacterium]|uniref:Peptidoglycan/LPS O-acetylase OafA/YrhL n=1 Tax=Phenylobacterium koreense TaxID=266125 RepID=A0ABV2EKP2_9CAUL